MGNDTIQTLAPDGVITAMYLLSVGQCLHAQVGIVWFGIDLVKLMVSIGKWLVLPRCPLGYVQENRP